MSLIIISVYYNRAEQVEESVKSLLRAAPEESKVILVDDGSTDQTRIELEKFSSDKRVSVQTGNNQGFTKALVQAIDTYADPERYKYMAIYGSGDLCAPDKYRKQLNYLDEHDDVVALGTGHKVISYSNGHITLEESDFYEASEETLTRRVPFTQGSVVYRLSAYKKSGGYNSVFKYSQDKDLYYRLIRIGRIVRYPEALYTQYMFEDGASSNPHKKREQIKYQYLIRLNYYDKDEYLIKSKELEYQNINDVFSDDQFYSRFVTAQKRLILQGEFKLASFWCDILVKIKGKKRQFWIKKLLLTVDRISIFKFLTAKLFFAARKVLR